jgi:hypothetical protein
MVGTMGFPVAGCLWIVPIKIGSETQPVLRRSRSLAGMGAQGAVRVSAPMEAGWLSFGRVPVDRFDQSRQAVPEQGYAGAGPRRSGSSALS